AFVRKGATKPDVSSADAFKRSMLAARSIAYPDPAGGGASGIYVASLLERLGIAVEMKPKTKLFPPTEVLYASVASGEVEIGFNQISEILAQPTVELAGPLPSAIQNYTQFAPGSGHAARVHVTQAVTIFRTVTLAFVGLPHAHVEDCSDRVPAEPDVAADQPVAQTSLCQLEDLRRLAVRSTLSWLAAEPLTAS